MTQPTKPSPPSAGALRAAREIIDWYSPGTPDTSDYIAAEIIDRETGLAELLEAAKAILDPCSAPITAAGKLQHAIRKVEQGEKK